MLLSLLMVPYERYYGEGIGVENQEGTNACSNSILWQTA